MNPSSRRTLSVLVVDDDFRVAGVHASFVAQLAEFSVVGTAHSAAQARSMILSARPDLVLLDNYLPDRPGLELLPELACDVLMLTADAAAASVRAAFAGEAIGYLIKPFAPEVLKERLRAYLKYRALLSSGEELRQEGVDRAVSALHAADRQPAPKGQSPVTARLVGQALEGSAEPLSANDLADRLGIARATAQRYLAALVENGEATMNLRYGSTGRPEHEYLWAR